MKVHESKNMIITEQFFIRNSQLKDLHEMHSIEKCVYQKGWSLQIFQQSLSRNRGFVLVERSTNSITGYGICEVILDEFHILNICIHPDFQQQGLGKKILHFLVEKAREFSCKDIFLEVRVSNSIAIKMYSACGFNESGIRKNYYPGETDREDACQMCLSLL